MNNLDQRLINESLRIRESYLKSLEDIKKNEELIINIKNDLNDTYNFLKNDSVDKEFIENKIKDLKREIDNLNKITESITNNIKNLKIDANKLFENIKEKNPDVSEEDIKEILLPYIKDIDNKYDFS